MARAAAVRGAKLKIRKSWKGAGGGGRGAPPQSIPWWIVVVVVVVVVVAVAVALGVVFLPGLWH